MPRISDGEAKKWIDAYESMFAKPSVKELLEKRPGRRGKVPSKTTIRQYGYCMRWLAERMDGFEAGESIPCPEDVLQYMEEAKVSNGRRKNIYVAMKMWYLGKENPSCCEKFSTHLKRCCDALANEGEKQIRSKRQNSNWVNEYVTRVDIWMLLYSARGALIRSRALRWIRLARDMCLGSTVVAILALRSRSSEAGGTTLAGPPC